MGEKDGVETIKRELISCRLDEGIGVVTLDNPPMNALSEEMKRDIISLFDELNEKKEKINLLILTGAGKAFVAGADIKEFPTLTQESARARLQRSRQMWSRLEQFEKPMICAINGYCFGGGLEIAMICDLRIASEKAQLGQLEINVGTIPGAGGTQRLPRLVGEGIAKELVFTGKRITAEEAKSLHLLNKVVPHEKLLDEAMELARVICSKPPIAIRAAKEAITRGLNMTLMQGLQLEADLWCYLCGTEDQKEGARAFIEKRSPVYAGK